MQCLFLFLFSSVDHFRELEELEAIKEAEEAALAEAEAAAAEAAMEAIMDFGDLDDDKVSCRHRLC